MGGEAWRGVAWRGVANGHYLADRVVIRKHERREVRVLLFGSCCCCCFAHTDPHHTDKLLAFGELNSFDKGNHEQKNLKTLPKLLLLCFPVFIHLVEFLSIFPEKEK